jgi:hypothetical protein
MFTILQSAATMALALSSAMALPAVSVLEERGGLEKRADFAFRFCKSAKVLLMVLLFLTR